MGEPRSVRPASLWSTVSSQPEQPGPSGAERPTHAEARGPELPTIWSFVPAGVFSLVLAVVVFAVGSSYPREEEPGWVFGAFLLHVLTCFGCMRGSMVYLWRRRGRLPRGQRWVPWSFCLASSLVFLFWVASALGIGYWLSTRHIA